MHDDQHGTAIVSLAAIMNALKIVGKKKEDVRLVVSGPGAAGTASMKLYHLYGIRHIIACDSKGILSKNRSDLDEAKKSLLSFTNQENIDGSLKDAIR